MPISFGIAGVSGYSLRKFRTKLVSVEPTASFFFHEQLAFCHGMNKSPLPGGEEWRQIVDRQSPGLKGDG
jgi:hypothetical protein